MRARLHWLIAMTTATIAACSSTDGPPNTDGLTQDSGFSTSDGSPGQPDGSTSGGDASSDSGQGAKHDAGTDSASTADGEAGSADSGITPVTAPCDIFAAGGTPCVAAHSTVRALYGAYTGRLYQIQRASDNATKDISVASAGGFADSGAQDTFCSGTTCIVSVIYDQSPKANHLTPAPDVGTSHNDMPANAADLKITIDGHTVYGIQIHAGMGYRNDHTSGVATGDEPETEYMVTTAKYANNECCFDYGNAETDDRDDGAGQMEAVYFGHGSLWGTGGGTGPWVEADLENGLFAGGSTGKVTTDLTLDYDFVTAVVVGRSGSFALKGNDATTGMLQTMYDGPRPSGYDRMYKQGAIILGIGGDNSNLSTGAFYEGVMTSGAASNATLDAVQANIVAAHYGK